MVYDPYSRRRRSQLAAPQPDRDAPYAQRPSTLYQSRFTAPMGVGANRPLYSLVKPSGSAWNPYQTRENAQVDLKGSMGAPQPGMGAPQVRPPASPVLTNRPQAQPAQRRKASGSTLWLSPEGEAMKRSLDDALAAELASVTTDRQQIPALIALVSERMMTDQTEDLRRTDEGANARGLYNSGIRTTNREKVDLGYGRQRQDLASQAATQYSDLARRETGAYTTYQQGLAEALLQLAQTAAANGTSIGSGGGKRGDKKKKRKSSGSSSATTSHQGTSYGSTSHGSTFSTPSKRKKKKRKRKGR